MRLGAVLLALSLPGAALADGHDDAAKGAKGYVGPVPAYNHYGQPVRSVHHKRKLRRPVEILDVPGCPEGFTGLYRGSLNCQDGKLLKG